MTLKHSFFLSVVFIFGAIAFSTEPESKDQLSIIYLGKGSKLVLKKDLEIPANAGRLKFTYPIPNHYHDGCLLDLKASMEDRRMSAGREIVLSGKVKKTEETFITLEVERPQDITSITCTNAWDGQVTIARFKSAFNDQADLVLPEPNELPE